MQIPKGRALVRELARFGILLFAAWMIVDGVFLGSPVIVLLGVLTAAFAIVG